LKVKTLTPLWTGGVGGRVDRIHETGLLGSMRWWYEVLVRGLGGNACQGGCKCDFNVEKYIKSGASDEGKRLKEAGLCDVCQIFGATGWKRRFRLSIVEKNVENAKIQHPIKALPPNTPKMGSFEIQLQSLDHKFPADVIEGLIQFIADWGALGARRQMGFGIIEPMNGRLDTNCLYERLLTSTGSCHYPELPSLKNIFLARVRVNNAREMETFNLKHDLRQLFSTDRDVCHFVMGTTDGEKMAAKVKISCPYDDGLMRVWGWIPEEADCYNEHWDRSRIVAAIHSHLITHYNLEVWREMSSARDTVIPNTTGSEKFLKSLLGLKEG